MKISQAWFSFIRHLIDERKPLRGLTVFFYSFRFLPEWNWRWIGLLCDNNRGRETEWGIMPFNSKNRTKGQFGAKNKASLGFVKGGDNRFSYRNPLQTG